MQAKSFWQNDQKSFNQPPVIIQKNSKEHMRNFNVVFLLCMLLPLGCASESGARNGRLAGNYQPTYPLSSSAFPESRVYLVQPGDDAALIARHLCLSLGQLLALNPGTDWPRLKIGQRLYYSPPDNAPYPPP
ncbi:MAG TPA: LysM domain-containing protein [Verrucomicrobiae bacterium]|nr:LysM domain-containing protein [Verrucomicrobiae bacterium]